MSFFRWGPKLTVAAQRRQAEQRIAKLHKKSGNRLSPVVIEGRTIASSFWGKAWCDNLERYSDYANRLPRGRSYVRHSCVIDLQIAKGEIAAQVSGSSIYKVKVTIAPLAPKTWDGICRDCSTSIDSMVELLQGRLSKAVMDRVCRVGEGLFPTPKEIRLSCSCPDGVFMCKHIAATMYGVGARLDSRPEMLFLLRGVDQQQLIAQVSAAPMASAGTARVTGAKVLADIDLASVFGLDLAEPSPPSDSDEPAVAEVRSAATSRPQNAGKGARGAKKPKVGKTTRGTPQASGRSKVIGNSKVSGKASRLHARRKAQSTISMT